MKGKLSTRATLPFEARRKSGTSRERNPTGRRLSHNLRKASLVKQSYGNSNCLAVLELQAIGFNYCFMGHVLTLVPPATVA